MKFKTETQGGKIKPAGFKCEYTEDQLRELARCKADPLYFIENYCWIVHPTKGRSKFKLYEFQRRLIQMYVLYDRCVSLIARQSGKTETAAAFLLWWCIFKEDQRVLIASNKGDNAKAIMKRFKFMYEEIPWWLKPGVKMPTGWNVFSCEFDNGSTIVAETTTGNTGRGMPISLFYCDELAFVRPGVASDFWTSILPTISTGGRCIVTSTANTDEDLFAKIWLNAKLSKLSDPWDDGSEENKRTMMLEDDEDDSYETIYESPDGEQKEAERNKEKAFDGFAGFHAHWSRVPGRDETFKKKTLASGTSESEFARDFECKFVSKDATLVSATKLLALNQLVRPPRFVDQWGMRWYEDIKPNTAYAISLDPSEGVDKDDACIQVFEVPNLRQVAEWNNNNVDQTEQARMLLRTLKRIEMIQTEDPEHNGPIDLYYSVEKNGLGIGILNTIEQHEDKFPGLLIDSAGNKGRGLITTLGSKKRCAIELASLIERNLIVIRSKSLVSQLKTFIKRGHRYEAKQGSKDDIVMAAVLAVQLLEEIRYHEPDLDERIQVDLVDPGLYDDDDDDDDRSALLPVFG